jgi:hypothetical protein
LIYLLDSQIRRNGVERNTWELRALMGLDEEGVGEQSKGEWKGREMEEEKAQL